MVTETLEKYSEDELIGKALMGARIFKQISQAELSEITGISQHHIAEMESGKLRIVKKDAKIFASALDQSGDLFL